MNVAVYARVSSERQAEKDLSIPAQIKALKRHALEHGWDVAAEYVDEAESARTANRPAFGEMIAAARKKERPFEAILVWKLSRFARNREDSILYKSLLRKRGISVISINEKVDDSPAGHLLEGIIEVIDEFYSSNLSQDTLRGMRENIGRGFCNGGSTPFGYKTVKVRVGAAEKTRLAPNEAEMTIIQRIFRMAVEGKGGKEIAKALTADGLRTRAGNLFNTTGVNHILRNEVYTGALVWRSKNGTFRSPSSGAQTDVIRVPDCHTALVTRDDFDLVQQLLTGRRPSTRHPRTVSSHYLLSGFLHCGKCGSAMTGCWAKSGQYFYYQCVQHQKRGGEACGARSVSKDKLESFVLERIRQSILTDDNLKQLVHLVNEELAKNGDLCERQLSQMGRQLAQTQSKLGKLYAALETGKIDIEDLAPRIRELRAQQSELEAKRDEVLDRMKSEAPALLDLEAIEEYVSGLRELLGRSSFVEQKAFLRSFIKRIELNEPDITIEYVAPVPRGELTTTEEVLRIDRLGSLGRLGTCYLAVNGS
jgi:DNA invertase Pin-like site-specific DNA recombinase